MSPSEKLVEAINKRSGKRGLQITWETTEYANRVYMDRIPEENTKQDALVIGVGSGHEMLLNLMSGQLRSIDGVDPYIASDGNDLEDFQVLLDLIEELELGQRFTVHKSTIEDYLKSNRKRYDVIFAMDVLHHIFWTDERLRDSSLYEGALELFRTLRGVLKEGGVFVISEVEKSGLRPFLYNTGIAKGDVNYRTKQHWWEWDHALRQSGFRRQSRTVYVPFALRKMGLLLNNTLGLYTACNRYIMVYS